jgi:hypothetical protein
MALTPVRLGLVGYGAGGRWFHAPFVTAAQGITLAGFVARSDERAAEARADLPGVTVFRSLADMLEAGVDAVTITTPPPTHEELGRRHSHTGPPHRRQPAWQTVPSRVTDGPGRVLSTFRRPSHVQRSRCGVSS